MTQGYLPDCQTKNLGPLSCFIWSCQILGWTILPDLRVKTSNGTVLHLFSSPLEPWSDISEQAWWSYAFSKCKWKDDGKGLSLSIFDRRSPYAQAKHLPPLAMKFRTFGVLSGTAVARMRGQEEACCELCGGPQAGQRHLVLECPATKTVRDRPKYGAVPQLHTFTQCTGIPACSHPWGPLQ